MKIYTADFGVEEQKAKRLFDHVGEKWALVDMPYKYLNSSEKVYLTSCVHYKTGRKIPLSFSSHKLTLKNKVEEAIQTISRIYESLGKAEFTEELRKYEILNKL